MTFMDRAVALAGYVMACGFIVEGMNQDEPFLLLMGFGSLSLNYFLLLVKP